MNRTNPRAEAGARTGKAIAFMGLAALLQAGISTADDRVEPLHTPLQKILFANSIVHLDSGEERVDRLIPDLRTDESLSPLILVQPQPVVLREGDPLTLSFTLLDQGSVSIGWRQNGMLLTGQTDTTLRLPRAGLEHAGWYGAIIGTINGFTVTHKVRVDVLPFGDRASSGTPTSALPTHNLLDWSRGLPRPRFTMSANPIQSAADNLAEVLTQMAFLHQLLLQDPRLPEARAVDWQWTNPLFGPTSQQITRQPEPLARYRGTSATLSFEHGSTLSPQIQWYGRQGPIPGATQPDLHLSDLTPDHQGWYFAKVTFGWFATVTRAVFLEVREPASALLADTASGSATLRWLPPTYRTDGSPLEAGDVVGYRLYHGHADTGWVTNYDLVDAGLQSFELQGLVPGEHRFAISVIDRNGVISAPSTIGVKVI